MPFYFKSTFQWKRESQTTYCSRSIKEYHEWMTAPSIIVKLFSCCEQVVSLETTLRPELIPGYQAWTSVPELPLSRWENLINTFQKSNSYHLFKICIRSQDWYFGARSINSQKSWSETKVIPCHKKWLPDCIYSDEERPFHWEPILCRGGSRTFFRRGCTRLLLYFNTNKPHSSFFFCRIPVVLENRRSSQGGCAPPAPSP